MSLFFDKSKWGTEYFDMKSLLFDYNIIVYYLACKIIARGKCTLNGLSPIGPKKKKGLSPLGSFIELTWISVIDGHSKFSVNLMERLTLK